MADQAQAAAHWDAAYAQGDDTRSWYEEHPGMSLRMLRHRRIRLLRAGRAAVLLRPASSPLQRGTAGPPGRRQVAPDQRGPGRARHPRRHRSACHLACAAKTVLSPGWSPDRTLMPGLAAGRTPKARARREGSRVRLYKSVRAQAASRPQGRGRRVACGGLSRISSRLRRLMALSRLLRVRSTRSRWPCRGRRRRP
jgi:hypothetical protein